MSENSEHSPDDTETETKAIEDLPNDSSKSETKLMMNQADTALLEDEEMPTYISVSSTIRPDDSDIVNMKQSENESQEVEEDRSPSPSEDQAASSVYVLSSGEETDQHPYNDEDDEDEYGDSDDMENLELDNEFDSVNLRVNLSNMKHLMDDEDDEDEDDEDRDDEDSPRQMHNDDDGIDDNYDIRYYDGRSDDFILNRRLKNHHKEKSLSLQDLKMYKNNGNVGYFNTKHSQDLRSNYLNIPEQAVMYSMIQKKQPMPGKYHYVQSKVKRYIKDIKEQNRRSIEKHINQHQEETIYDKSDVDHKNNDTEKIKPTTKIKPATNKTIKDYAEKTIKELEIAETCENSMDKVTYNTTTSPLILNGQDNDCLEPIHEESMQNEVQIDVPFESTQNERDLVSTDKMQKQNGTIEDKSLKFNYSDKEVPHFPPASLIQNGHQEIFYNLRTLSYEEYMHGTSDSGKKTDLNRNAHVIEQEHVQSEAFNNLDLMDVSMDNEEEDACPLKIENIKSIKTISDETKNNNEQITFEKTNEVFKATSDASEVIALKKKLTQKTVKYNNLIDAYQKQLMENLKMKQELDELRKTLAKYEKENQPPEQKVASIQTDVFIDPVSNQHQDQTEPTHAKQSNNKILGSSDASTLSSIDQWSSSACNLSISMKPPEVTKTLHSDDSMLLTDSTPGKTTRSLSRAFITSSRILQTLSNITQGKTKPESPLIQNSKKRLNENVDLQNDNSSQCLPSNSKKRKIADVLGPSNFLQPFKVSQASVESHLKLNETLNTESQFKNSYDSINKNIDLQSSLSNVNTSQLGTATSTLESKMETADPDDNVKCFVYHEDENNKDRSFLIQAEELGKDKAINEKKRIQECGPFLLGNVEVRMSEINGTINIWGKEISQESTAETENETETSPKVKDKNYHYWQKTPNTRFNGSNLVCSTSKKSKNPPKFELSSASNFSCLHSPSFNIARASCSTDKADKLCSSNACEDCDFSKHKEWLRYKRIHPQEKLHSCCTHDIDISEQKCNCSLRKEKQRFEDSFNYSKEKLSTQEHQQSFSKNLEPNKHLHDNIVSEDNEHICKNCTAYHSPHNPENYQENHKCCNMLKETCESLIMNTDRECNESCNHLSPNVHEEEPLITLKQCNERPETRRRRITGKRVRGILMDLVRGCGDCYNPNVSGNNKSCTHKKESCLRSCPSQIKISPCASPEPSCSNAGQPAGRCCHAYAQRIESQLEEFRMEMEKMRSRSDAILNMLSMLHSVDTN